MEDISPNNNITTLTTTTTTTANNTNSSSIADNSRSLRRKWPSFPTYTNHNWMLTALFLLLPIPSLHTMVAQAFPTGAPLSACSHLMPVHIDGELMESASPYILLLNDTQYGGELSPIKRKWSSHTSPSHTSVTSPLLSFSFFFFFLFIFVIIIFLSFRTMPVAKQLERPPRSW